MRPMIADRERESGFVCGRRFDGLVAKGGTIMESIGFYRV